MNDHLLNLLPYRDIRSDIRDRMREAEAEREHHLKKAEEADQEAKVLARLLEKEEARFSNGGAFSVPKEPEESLADFLLKLLEVRPMNKSEMREYAVRSGYVGDGRSIHATVVNLSRTGKIQEIAEDVYAIPGKPGSYDLTGHLLP
jgi:hypothetical protein